MSQAPLASAGRGSLAKIAAVGEAGLSEAREHVGALHRRDHVTLPADVSVIGGKQRRGGRRLGRLARLVAGRSGPG